MRRLAAFVVGAVMLAAAAPARAADPLLDAAGSELLATHVAGADGGWAWPSAIQAPHRQTDRDVGAAGIVMGLLALWQTSGDRRYLTGAERAGDWLLAVAQPAHGGLRWPDYADPGHVSDTHFTSFDDGAPGIADALWRLGAVSGRRRYQRAAAAGMRWIAAQARGVRGRPCPTVCRWRFYDGADDFETGMGEGQAGVVYALDAFARRLHDARLERLATGGAAYLESVQEADGSTPERIGQSTRDTGFLSGASGIAFMDLALYRHTGSPRWARDARRSLRWVAGQAEHRAAGGLAWPIEAGDPDADGTLATGFEEGAAGIGWVELQAWKVLREPAYEREAIGAGRWLLGEAAAGHAPGAWPEDLGGRLVHTGLNNGAAGIGWFLHDLAEATATPGAADGAADAREWLASVARTAPAGVFWFEHSAALPGLPHEPSWHWGQAGIAAFFARLDGWAVDMPGEEPALATTSENGGSVTG